MGVCSPILSQLATGAPALRVLEFAPPYDRRTWSSRGGVEHYLEALGKLSQLTELRLHSWKWRKADLPCIAHLSGLINLQVPTPPILLS